MGIGSRTNHGYQNLQIFRSHSQPSVATLSHPQIQLTIDRIVLYLLLKKNPRIIGSVQFKALLFKDQLYTLYILLFLFLWRTLKKQIWIPKLVLEENFKDEFSDLSLGFLELDL